MRIMKIYVICADDGEPLSAYESRADADREVARAVEDGEGCFSIDTIELYCLTPHVADAAVVHAGDVLENEQGA